ncbi:MAG: diiron oxygenase [Waterburya sp.]
MKSKIIDKLTDACKENYYNPYQLFDWSVKLSDDHWWMSPELLSVYDTPFMNELTESQLKKLSKWECINFYSLNVHGIRELLLEITKRIHVSSFTLTSDFFHHYIGEENEHMWFFAKFCLTYGSKIYPTKNVKSNQNNVIATEIENFMVFARILIFEEIVDYFNVYMGSDHRLPSLIQQINQVHHQDESRHIAFGRQVVTQYHQELRQKLNSEQLMEVENYIKRYIITSVESLYNPAVYKDAGMNKPYQVRRRLLQEPGRQEFHRQYLQRTLKFLVKNQILSDQSFI